MDWRRTAITITTLAALACSTATAGDWQTYLSDDFSSADTMFYTGPLGTAYYGITDTGKYLIDGINSTGDSMAILTDNIYYYYLESECEVTDTRAGDLASCGLVFHYNKTTRPGQNSYYVFYVYSDGYYGVKRVIGDSDGRVDILIPLAATDMIDPAYPNVLGVDAQGSHFDLYINGKYVDGFTDVRIDGGGVGFYTAKQTTAQYDNFSVKVERREQGKENVAQPETRRDPGQTSSGFTFEGYSPPIIPRDPNRPVYPWEVGYVEPGSDTGGQPESSDTEQPPAVEDEQAPVIEGPAEPAGQKPEDARADGQPDSQAAFEFDPVPLRPAGDNSQPDSVPAVEQPDPEPVKQETPGDTNDTPIDKPEQLPQPEPEPVVQETPGDTFDTPEDKPEQLPQPESKPAADPDSEIVVVPGAPAGDQGLVIPLPPSDDNTPDTEDHSEEATEQPTAADEADGSAADEKPDDSSGLVVPDLSDLDLPADDVEQDSADNGDLNKQADAATPGSSEEKTDEEVVARSFGDFDDSGKTANGEDQHKPLTTPGPAEQPKVSPDPPSADREVSPESKPEDTAVIPAEQPDDSPEQPAPELSLFPEEGGSDQESSSGSDTGQPDETPENTAAQAPETSSGPDIPVSEDEFKKPWDGNRLPLSSSEKDPEPEKPGAADAQTAQPNEQPAPEQPEPEELKPLELTPADRTAEFIPDEPEAAPPADTEVVINSSGTDNQAPEADDELALYEPQKTESQDMESAIPQPGQPAVAQPLPDQEKRFSVTIIDDFSDSSWPVADSGVSTYAYVGAAYEINNLNAETMAISFQANSLARAEYLVEAEFVDGLVDAGFGLAGHFTASQGTASYYGLFISNTGDYLVLKVVNGRETVLKNWTPCNLLRANAPNQLMLDVNGPEIRIVINGREITRLMDSELRSGGYALLAGPGVAVRFDNLVVNGNPAQ